MTDTDLDLADPDLRRSLQALPARPAIDLEDAWTEHQVRLVRRRRRQHVEQGALMLAGIAAVAVAVVVVVTSIVPTAPPRPSATPQTPWRTVSSTTPLPFTAPGILGPGSSAGLTCPAASVCYVESLGPAVGGGTVTTRRSAYRSTDGGASWEALPLPPDVTLESPFVCPTPTSCVASATVGPDPGGFAVLLATTDRGDHWVTHRTLDNGAYVLLSLVCVSFSTCMGHATAVTSSNNPEHLDVALLRTVDGGNHWTVGLNPWPGGQMACAGRNCVLLDGETVSSHAAGVPPHPSFALYSSDAGRSWSTGSVPADWIGGSVPLSCPGGDHCLALGFIMSGPFHGRPWSTSALVATTDGGRTWHQQSTFAGLPRYATTPTSLSCPTPEDCWATLFDDDGPHSVIDSSRDGGRSWNLVTLPAGTPPTMIPQLTCPTTEACTALAVLDDSRKPVEVLTNNPHP